MSAILHFIKNALCWEIIVLWLCAAALFIALFIGAFPWEEEDDRH